MDRIGGLAYITALYYFWDAILQGHDSLLGYTREQMLSYVLAMNLLRSFVFTGRGWELVHEIASGRLSNYLLRPVSYVGYALALDLAQKSVHAAASVLEIAFLIWVFSAPIYLPSRLSTWPLFLAATGLASLLYFLLEFIVSAIAFWTSESGGPLFCLQLFLQFAAGAFFPLDVLPVWIRKALVWTPFPYLVFTPINIYLERTAWGQALGILAIQAAWLAVFYAVLRTAWQKGLQNYAAEGG